MKHCTAIRFLKLAGRGDVLMRAMTKNPALRQVAFNTPMSGRYTPPFSSRPDSLRMALRYPTFDIGRKALAGNIQRFRSGLSQEPFVSPTTMATAPKPFLPQLKAASQLRREDPLTRSVLGFLRLDGMAA